MLTEKECKEALDGLRNLERYENFKKWNGQVAPQVKADVIEQLIREHFSNPPLKFEELKEMKNQPVWNNEDKKWYLVSYFYKPFVLNQWIREECIAIKLIDEHRNTISIGLNCDGIIGIEEFKENRFYRKQVEK